MNKNEVKYSSFYKLTRQDISAHYTFYYWQHSMLLDNHVMVQFRSIHEGMITRGSAFCNC
jgi:hypothetical protein